MFRFFSIFLFLLSSFCDASDTSQPFLRFSPIEKDNGLAGNRHNSIGQDHSGMMWISSNNGVVRYDGMSFQRFKYDINDQTSVNGLINDIHIDAHGQVWFGTPTGIQTFIADNENFKSYNIKDLRGSGFYSNIKSIDEYGSDSLLLLSLLDGPILFNTQEGTAEYMRHTLMRDLLPQSSEYRASCVDSRKNILFSTKDDGLYFWDNSALRGIHLLPGTSGITAIIADTYGRFWFPYGKELGVFDIKTNKVERFEFNIADKLPYSAGINTLCFYKNKLFVGTVGDGLFVIDTLTRNAHRYLNSPADPFSVPDNGIATLYQDRADNLWVGTTGNGLAVVKHAQKKFMQDKVLTSCDFSRCNYVNAIIIGKDGTLWAGMDGGGLNYRRKGDREFTSLLAFPNKNIYGITALADGRDQCVWVGTFDQGLFKIDYRGKLISHINTMLPSPSGDRLKSNFVESIFVASDGKIWLATNSGSVVIYDETTGKMKHLVLDPHNIATSISCTDATSFFEDSQNRIWITTYWGLNLFDREGTYIDKWVNDEYRLSNLSSNVVNRIIEDEEGVFWIATGYGINYFSYGDKQFKLLSEEDGLINNVVNRLELDKNGDVWASTDEGLSKYDRKQKRFYNFYEYNGLASTSFRKCSFSSSDGMLYFGTENGIISFYPEQINIDTVEPKILITAFKLFNKTLTPKEGSVLPKSIHSLSEIRLSANQNYIGFEFSALSFVDYQQSKFKYRMLGTDQDWIETDATKRFADYSNLAPGEYTFQVSGTNNDGVWGTHYAEIKIIIVPPFYKTAFFRFLLISAFLLGLFFLMRWRERQLTLDKIRLEKAIEERTSIIASQNHEINEQNEQLRLLNNTKDRFFSIIAHDLKNPLNALMGFSGLLNDKYDDLPDAKKKKFIGVINESSRSMYGLLINLLDWSRSQTGTIRFEPAVYNLLPIVEESLILISSQSEHKGIHLDNKISANYRIVADINMLKTVLRNLLTNAIKFSFRSDTVIIGISDERPGYITIYIKDSGVGMDPDQQDSLFKGNAGGTNLGTEKEQGSGLGLVICKEFIERNKGQIWCSSQKGKGTTMFFNVPLA